MDAEGDTDEDVDGDTMKTWMGNGVGITLRL
jgi:hypothetical protein